MLYPGETDPAAESQVAGAQTGSPDGTPWSTFQITHRGSMSQSNVDDLFDTPVLLGSSGGATNWSAMTIIAPGEVNGVPTLWARDDSTGAIYGWPLTLDSNGVPELGTAAVGAPVTATSGTVVGGVTLTSAAYPFAVSSGPLTGGTCGTSDLTACPGIYAEDAEGNLWYYQGQPVSGSASPLSGSRVLVGIINPPVHLRPGAIDGRGSAAAFLTQIS